MVTEKTSHWVRKDKRCKSLGVDCTKAQQLEIQASYEFFKCAMKKELEIFYAAFFSKNYIFPQNHKNKNESSYSEQLKTVLMMEGMNEYSRLKEIGRRERAK